MLLLKLIGHFHGCYAQRHVVLGRWCYWLRLLGFNLFHAQGSDEVQVSPQHIEICDYHEECGARREQIKMTKGFVAKEPVKGHMENVGKGLKLYEDVFTSAELLKLNDLVDEIRTAGQNGELSGETYILFNKQIKGNKREQILLGVPVFEQIKDEAFFYKAFLLHWCMQLQSIRSQNFYKAFLITLYSGRSCQKIGNQMAVRKDEEQSKLVGHVKSCFVRRM